MTKAKTNVTTMVPSEETKEFKKRRMKEVRTMVARAHKQGKRIDQMGFEGTDIPRAMIALQDLLTKTQERHQKATKHIALGVELIYHMQKFYDAIVDGATLSTMEQQARISELSSALYDERRSHAETATMLHQMHSEKRNVQQDLEAVKRSMKVLNG